MLSWTECHSQVRYVGEIITNNKTIRECPLGDGQSFPQETRGVKESGEKKGGRVREGGTEKNWP